MTYTKACTRSLVHLAKNHYHVFQQVSFFHCVVKLISFTATFADSTKHAYAFVLCNRIVYHLCKQNRFSYSGPSKQTRFATTFQWYQYIYGCLLYTSPSPRDRQKS